MLDWVERPNGQRVPRVWVSALDGSGLDLLRDCIARAATGTLAAEFPPSHDNMAAASSPPPSFPA
jgi:GTP-binding protein HflX